MVKTHGQTQACATKNPHFLLNEKNSNRSPANQKCVNIKAHDLHRCSLAPRGSYIYIYYIYIYELLHADSAPMGSSPVDVRRIRSDSVLHAHIIIT